MSPSSRCSSGIARSRAWRPVVADTEQVVREVAHAVSGQERVFGADGRVFDLEGPFLGSPCATRSASTPASPTRSTSRTATSALLRVSWSRAVSQAWRCESQAAVSMAISGESGRVSAPLRQRSEHCTALRAVRGRVELCNGFDELTNPSEQRAGSSKTMRADANKADRLTRSTNASRGAAGGHAPFRRQTDRFRSPVMLADRGPRASRGPGVFPPRVLSRPSACPALLPDRRRGEAHAGRQEAHDVRIRAGHVEGHEMAVVSGRGP